MPTLHKKTRKRPWDTPVKRSQWGKNQSFYNTTRWRKYSINFRLKNRRCYVCNKIHSDIKGLMVEHLIPIEQGGSKWDSRNHGSICKNPCAKRKNAKERNGLIYEYRLNDRDDKIPL